ncbi:trehalose synthase, partial [Rhizobium ruizarguesonis]
IRMRKEAPEIGWGDFSVIYTGDDGVLALRYYWRGNSVLILHNLHAQPAEVTFDPYIGEDGRQLIDIADGASSKADEKGFNT